MTDLQWLKKYAKWAKMSERARVRYMRLQLSVKKEDF